ncbi:MAG: hypothetical protein ABSA47_08955 [Verrucomicrobiota bacterium]
MSVPRHFPLARCFLVVVAGGLLWRLLRYFLNFELTIDESYIMNNVTARTFRELLNPLDYGQVSPPGFLWATKLMDSWVGNEWGVRLLPLLAGLGAVVVFWGLCVEVLRGLARWVAWAVFSVSFVPVAEGTRAKGYTFDLLAALLMFWLMSRWLRRGRRARELLWLGLCAPVLAWFSYTSLFVIGAISAVFAARALMALAAGSAIWLYEVNIRASLQASKASGMQDFWRLGYPPLDHPGLIPAWLLEVHTGRGFAWPMGENHFGSSLTTLLWLTGMVVYWRRGDRWVWMLFVAPHVLLLAAAFLHKYPYGANPRICMFLGPGICLFLGAGAQYLLDRVGRRRRRRSYRVAALLLLLVAIGGALRDVVLRAEEFHGPGIRGALVDAGRLVGTNGQFVVLNPIRPIQGETGQVLTYYMSRRVAQPVVWNGRTNPPAARSGSNLAVVAVTTIPSGLDSDPFGGFEERYGKPLTRIGTQVGRMAGKTKDRVVVRVYHVE